MKELLFKESKDYFEFWCMAPECGAEFRTEGLYQRDCPECGAEGSGKLEAQYVNGELFTFSGSCGAWVGQDTGEHLGLARCFCGWPGDGYRELLEAGETIEEDY